MRLGAHIKGVLEMQNSVKLDFSFYGLWFNFQVNILYLHAITLRFPFNVTALISPGFKYKISPQKIKSTTNLS